MSLRTVYFLLVDVYNGLESLAQCELEELGFRVIRFFDRTANTETQRSHGGHPGQPQPGSTAQVAGLDAATTFIAGFLFFAAIGVKNVTHIPKGIAANGALVLDKGHRKIHSTPPSIRTLPPKCKKS